VEVLISTEMDEVEDGAVIMEGPDICDIEEGQNLPIGILVEVAGREMQSDFEPILERQFHHLMNYIQGIMHIGQRNIMWVRIGKGAVEKGFSFKHLGVVLHGKLHQEFGAILDKVQVKIFTVQDKVEEVMEIAKQVYTERDLRLGSMTDETEDVFYSCTLCQSFAPSHVCVITPERIGMCGSGLIDLVAELYLARIVDLRGKFQTEFSGQSEAHKRFVKERLRQRDGEPVFIVVAAEESGNAEPVVLSQIDLDAMMRSKAAMYAILVTLIGQVGVEFSELERIYVAGAFGKHIDPHQAITLGMLPDLPISTFQPVGNSSLRGAEMILVDHAAFERAKEIGRKITYIELNVNQEFMIRFSGSRFIPHTDPEHFPSVPHFR
ncbi:MAG: DUF4445 domain-containing protein, partial [Candidatus Electrothrix sp. AR4]|nr:DUF4445 domain-containing protein [Candidatus Electrothrix sp. AR4]